MRKRKFSILLIMGVTSLLVAAVAFAGVAGDASVKVGQKLVDWGSPDSGKASSKTPPPSAAGVKNPDCDPKKEAEAKKKIDQDETKSSMTNHVNLSCLDKYKKFSMGGLLGYPNPWDLVQQAIGQVCSAADMEVSKATAPVNQGIPLPGGVGRVDTKATFGSDTGNSAGVNVGGGGVSTGGNGVNQGGSGYTVPPLWK